MHQMLKFASVSLLVVVCGCGKKDEKKTETAEKSDRVPANSPPPAPVPEKPSGKPKYTCDDVIPTALRDKYLKGKKFETDMKPLNENLSNCNIADDTNPAAGSVSVNCMPGIDTPESRKIAADGIKKMYKEAAKDVTDIGAGGIYADIGPVKQYSIWDDNSKCQIIVTASFDTDLAGLTKDIVAAFPPK